jgi:ubiquinone/menaquinone biosynthesis C-methylase UbiE
MERVEDFDLCSNSVLQNEHRHRYQWAAHYAHGDVCDLACGCGYGSEIISSKLNVTKYIGIDINKDAVIKASLKYANNNRFFICSTANEIPIAKNSIDTFITLETLEHLLNPESALREIRRVIRNNGVLVGSVPSKYFEERCEKLYGPNQFHISRFTIEMLSEILKPNFKSVYFQYSALEIISHFGEIIENKPISDENLLWIDYQQNDKINGSIHFIASNSNNINSGLSLHKQAIFCLGLHEYIASEIQPLRNSIKKNENLINKKDLLLEEVYSLIKEKENSLSKASEFIQKKDEQIANDADLIRQKDIQIAKASELIKQRDDLIATLTRKKSWKNLLPWNRNL